MPFSFYVTRFLILYSVRKRWMIFLKWSLKITFFNKITARWWFDGSLPFVLMWDGTNSMINDGSLNYADFCCWDQFNKCFNQLTHWLVVLVKMNLHGNDVSFSLKLYWVGNVKYLAIYLGLYCYWHYKTLPMFIIRHVNAKYLVLG